MRRAHTATSEIVWGGFYPRSIADSDFVSARRCPNAYNPEGERDALLEWVRRVSVNGFVDHMAKGMFQGHVGCGAGLRHTEVDALP